MFMEFSCCFENLGAYSFLVANQFLNFNDPFYVLKRQNINETITTQCSIK